MYKSLCCTLVTNMMLYVTYFGVLKSKLERQEVSESAVPGGVVVTGIRGRGDWYRESLENDHRDKCRWGRGDDMGGSRF